MPLLIALLSLLSGCSGMLDLPDQPRVSSETVAPLESPPDSSRTWHGRGQPSGRGSDAEGALADAGTALDREAASTDAGLEVRLSSR